MTYMALKAVNSFRGGILLFRKQYNDTHTHTHINICIYIYRERELSIIEHLRHGYTAKKIRSNDTNPSAHSMAVMPSDHTSAKCVYSFPSMTSGDMNNGVPITVLAFSFPSLICDEIPKSAI